MKHVKKWRSSHLSLDSTIERANTRARAVRPLAIATHLAPDDIEELRSAIACSLCEGEMNDTSDFAVDEALRKSIRVICAKARLQRVRAEHVLIDVKQIWTSIPVMPATRTSEQLSRIVTACIEEYYAKDRISPR